MSAVVVMRGLEIGTPDKPEDAYGDGFPIPTQVVDTFLPAVGFPWGEHLEDPDAHYSADIPFTPDVQIDIPDLGNKPIVGAWDGVYGERGPVVPFGYEVSGGLNGDQAFGRVMRFQNMGPERYAVDGVQEPSWADELAARLAYNGQGQVTEAEYTTSLLQAI